MKLVIRTYFTLLSILIVSCTTIYANSDRPPQRIVSLSPNVTEIIYGLGAWDKIVGVTMYSDFPPEAKTIPKVGGWVNPNLEAIVNLKPDLVIFMKDQDSIFGDNIRKLGLNTLSVDSNNSIKDIQNSILQLGKILQKEKEAENLAAKIRSKFEEMRSKTSKLSKKRVLFIVGRNPGTLEDIYVIGRDNYINELINLAGGENVVESNRFALKIAKDAILSFDPEVIIEITYDKTDNRDSTRETWSTLKEISAIKNNEVHIVSSSELLRPSQRIIEGAHILAHILHPEVFERYHGATKVQKH
ncbi:MAG: helical backbone metal receptor [Thermodesulfobacteriota bacterium]